MRKVIYSLFLINLAVLSACSQGGYEEMIREERKERDSFMRTSKESPFKNKLRDFKGLKYFDINQKYQILAKLEKIKPVEEIEIKMTQNQAETYLKYAYAYFTLEGKEYKLLLLKRNLREPILFLAFTDKTSGIDTYGGGRYLDIPFHRGQGDKIKIDFNKVYNPFCTYNEKYDCPLPPRENHLDIAIKAGEKNYK